MNRKEIEEMIKLMNDNDLLELEIERDGLKVKLKKEAYGIKESIQKKDEQTKEERESKKAKLKEESLIEIKSPMVGTFYRAPAPDVPPFTDVGKVIKPQDVVCIIEAMKLMNEIKSEVKGEIVEVAVENGEPVEYGQTLFKVKPIS
jgi:acetyl-CoA carboxylase biotin carboxyl carrier protein